MEVYLDDDSKPDVGKGLNKPALVTMERIFKLDKSTGRPTTDPEAIDRYTGLHTLEVPVSFVKTQCCFEFGVDQ